MKKYNLDGLRIVLACGIVAIHIYPFANINVYLDYAITRIFLRIGVPIFLMITGYFTMSKALEEKKELIQYTKKILILYGISTLLYIPIHLWNDHFSQLSIFMGIKELLFTGTFYHLWYFPALLLGMWITYFLLKTIHLKGTAIVVILLYLLGLLGDAYYGLISYMGVLNTFYDGVFFLFDYTRNGVFYVPLFLYLGVFIRNTHCLIQKKQHLFLLIGSILFLLIEGMILLFLQLPRHTSMYLYLPIVCYLLFTFFIQYGKGKQVCFRFFSTWIYILHPLFIVLVSKCASLFHLSIEKFHLINYLLVLFLTFICVFFLYKIKERRKTN